MAMKSREQVPENVRREMDELFYKTRGSHIKRLLWTTVFTESDRKWIQRNISDDEWTKSSPVQIWMKLRGVSDRRAILEIALKCELITREKHEWLAREIGIEGQSLPVEVRDAILARGLVLIETPPSAYWCGKEIACDWEKMKVVWEYFFKLARAAKRRGHITFRDFDARTDARNLTNWKHRLCKCDEVLDKIGTLISSRRGDHWLDLPPEKIHVFGHIPGQGLRELNH